MVKVFGVIMRGLGRVGQGRANFKIYTSKIRTARVIAGDWNSVCRGGVEALCPAEAMTCQNTLKT